MDTTVFERMSGLAREHGAINLGQGFPDRPGPRGLLEAAARALLEKSNQYPPMAGLPELRRAVAAHYRRHQTLDLDEREVVITSGATEALAAAILALVEAGDEVLIFEPSYDAYAPLVRRAGGVPRPIRLQPPDWRIDAAALADAVTARTTLMIFNDPMNPTGRTARPEELALLAETCVAHDLTAICDEVWEHVVFDGHRHRSLMTLPGMRERTVKIGSAGKIFSLTGWKLGWMCAAPPLAEGLARGHQFLTFTSPPHLQWAVAEGLEAEQDWFRAMPRALARARDRLNAGLLAAGYHALPSDGTYFLTIDLEASGIPLDDVTFCDRLVREAGVAAIPVSAFYSDAPVRRIVRLCFAKDDATLDAAAGRLAQARSLFAGPA